MLIQRLRETAEKLGGRVKEIDSNSLSQVFFRCISAKAKAQHSIWPIPWPWKKVVCHIQQTTATSHTLRFPFPI